MSITISKKNSQIVVVVILGLIGYLIYGEYAESKSVVVCGRFVELSDNRGASVVRVEFLFNGVKKTGSIYSSLLKDEISLDSLLNVKCVRFKCSTFDDDYFNIIDKRYLKE